MPSALLPPAARPPLRPATPVALPLPAPPSMPGLAVERRPPADGGPPLGENEVAPMPGTMSFGEFLSGLNPLQHLPVVGTIYRAVTGDIAPPPMRILGGLLTGGPIGFATSLASVFYDTVIAPPATTAMAAAKAYRAQG